MASTDRKTKSDLIFKIDHFIMNYQVNLYSIVHLILRNSSDAAKLVSTANYNKIISNNIRFSSTISWIPPTSTLNDVEYIKQDDIIKLKVSTIGVAGIIGGLPQPYSDYITDLIRQGDTSLADYLDIYNHRINSLFYQNFQKHHLDLSLLSESKAPQSRIMYILAGWYAGQNRSFTELNSELMYSTVRYFIRRVSSVRNVELALSRTLNCSVRIYTLALRRLKMSPLANTLLGKQCSRLGTESVLGDHYINADGSIDIELSGLTYDAYYYYLLNPLSIINTIDKFMRNFTKVSIRRLNVKLKPENIQPLSIFLENNVRLGYNSWLQSKKSPYQSNITLNIFATSS